MTHGEFTLKFSKMLTEYEKEIRAEERAKTIDEFKSKLLSDEVQKCALDDVFETCRMYDYSQCIDAFFEYVEAIAEQMKGGAE